MLIKIEDGAPVGSPLIEDNFRQLFPKVSFPKPLSREAVEPFGYGLFKHSDKPTVGRYEEAIEILPVQDDDGVWVQEWDTVEVSQEARQAIDSSKANSVRAARNTLLSQTDWTQAKDIPDEVSSAWTSYRQALRDIPEQAGFPWDVSWTQKP